jgi:hypothetical protein
MAVLGKHILRSSSRLLEESEETGLRNGHFRKRNSTFMEERACFFKKLQIAHNN